MDIAKELATMCVTSMVKAAADPRAVREQFELAADREGIERRHAGRLNDIYRSRAADEDQSLGGYVNTGLSRATLPIPQTGTEALMRGGIMAGTGALGYHVGNQLTPTDPDAIKQVFSLGGGGKKGGGPPMKKVFDSVGAANKAPKKPIDGLYNTVALSTPENLASAFGGEKRLPTGAELGQKLRGLGSVRSFDDVKKHVGGLVKMPDATPTAGGQALRSAVGAGLGGKKPAARAGASTIVSQEVKNILKQNKDIKKPMMPGLLGAGLGVGAGALATGIPMALRALYQKHQGGEAAVRARSERDESTTKAEGEATKRDKLLASLQSGGLKKASDNNFDEASMTALLQKAS